MSYFYVNFKLYRNNRLYLIKLKILKHSKCSSFCFFLLTIDSISLQISAYEIIKQLHIFPLWIYMLYIYTSDLGIYLDLCFEFSPYDSIWNSKRVIGRRMKQSVRWERSKTSRNEAFTPWKQSKSKS